ncbi:MAG: hypothetical protein J2P35_00575 [Actinobacteria bacterium]|nr:hypothetical protein [Actinomycetota bacterium]MBO0785435.1 hypothetical protein [Actinomycetota bacterium]
MRKYNPRHAIVRAVRSLPKWARASILATAAGGSIAGLAVAALPAGASTGPRLYSNSGAGYAVTGAQFRYVAASAYLRNPAQYSAVTDGIGWGVTLTSADYVIDLGVSDTTTSGTTYSPAVDVYKDNTLVPGAPDYDAKWCPAGGQCQPASAGGSFPVGETVTQDLFYNTATGVVSANEYDAAGNLFTFAYHVGTGQSFHTADVGAGMGKFTAPSSATQFFRFTNIQLTSYSGHRAGLVSWWTRHKKFMTSDGTSAGTTEASPSNLSYGNFTVTLQP